MRAKTPESETRVLVTFDGNPPSGHSHRPPRRTAPSADPWVRAFLRGAAGAVFLQGAAASPAGLDTLSGQGRATFLPGRPLVSSPAPCQLSAQGPPSPAPIPWPRKQQRDRATTGTPTRTSATPFPSRGQSQQATAGGRLPVGCRGGCLGSPPGPFPLRRDPPEAPARRFRGGSY